MTKKLKKKRFELVTCINLCKDYIPQYSYC